MQHRREWPAKIVVSGILHDSITEFAFNVTGRCTDQLMNKVKEHLAKEKPLFKLKQFEKLAWYQVDEIAGVAVDF